MVQNLEGEIWKDIEGFPSYRISSLGRIKRIRKVMRSNYNPYITEEVILNPPTTKIGYKRTSLIDINGNKKFFYIHRLVALAFIPNAHPDILFQVNHIDCNKQNNAVSNLEWCSDEGNKEHARKHGIYALKAEKKVKLTKLKTGEIQIFDSISKANKFLGYKGVGPIYLALKNHTPKRGFLIEYLN